MYSFNLRNFEKLAWSEKKSTQVEAIISIIEFLDNYFDNLWTLASISGLEGLDVSLQKDNKRLMYTKLCSRITNSIASILLNIKTYDKEIALSLRRLLDRKSLLSDIFKASIQGDTDHYLRTLLAQFNQSQEPTESNKQLLKIKFAILYCNNSNIHISEIFDDYCNEEYIGCFLFSLLTDSFNGSENAYKNYSWLLKKLPDRIMKLSRSFKYKFNQNFLLDPIFGAYFNCSYNSQSYRHKIKGPIHELIRSSELTAPLKSYEDKLARRNFENTNLLINHKAKKPTLFIMHEWFHKDHAMYRCYSQLINDLKLYFNVIGVCFMSMNIDESAKEIFHKHYILQGSTLSDKLNSLIKLLDQYKPKSIYYPSIGMDPCIILISSFRLADKQIYSLGHPAPAMSKAMDASTSYGSESFKNINNSEIFGSSRIQDIDPYLTKNIQINYLPMTIISPTIKSAKEWKLADYKCINKKEKVRIAITASPSKITYDFFTLLKSIRDKHEDKLEFFFFLSSARELIDIEIYNFLESNFYGISKNFPTLSYDKYMKELSNCDMFFSPFPFGSSNSLFDCVRLGILGPCLGSTESHVQFAEILLYNRCGLEDLIATSKEQYIEIVNELINAYFGEASNYIHKIKNKVTPSDSIKRLTSYQKIDNNIAKEMYEYIWAYNN